MNYYPTYQALEAMQVDRLRQAARERLGRQHEDILTDEFRVPAPARTRRWTLPWVRREPAGSSV